MNRIKSIHIQGFKKFTDLYVEFNDHLNVIVGGNEAGKTTVLEAIQILVNQNYRNADKSVLKDLFNQTNIASFIENPSLQSLPEIVIEAEFVLDNPKPDNSWYYGASTKLYDNSVDRFGIRFSCSLDNSYLSLVESSIDAGEIPYEFYVLDWETFGGHPYQTSHAPFKLLTIDTSQGQTSRSFNYFNKTLFNSKHEEHEKSSIKNSFRSGVESLFNGLPLKEIGESRSFGIDMKKLVFENIVSVNDNGIPLENHGSGMESLIKTQIALERSNNIDILLIEEPENHLAFSTLKMMIAEISSQKEDTQIILVTHSGMIASGLNLKNLLWISDDHSKGLRNLNSDDADFFVKAANNSVLQVLLSEKVLLVEGAAEFILIPKLYQQTYGESLDSSGITMVSCGGLTYKRYLAVTDMVSKKVAVLTDNDKKQKKLADIAEFNSNHKYQQIFAGENLENWTFEVALFNENEPDLKEIIEIEDMADYSFHGVIYTPVLGKMLNNKAETAYTLLKDTHNLKVPEYIKRAFEWLRR